MLAEEIADTLRERDDTHGDPVVTHQIAAAMWSAYFGIDVSPADVAMCQNLAKVARYKSGGYDEDHFRDIMGYAEIANDCERS